MTQSFLQDEFDQPLDEAPSPLPVRRWSLLTLMAARPNSKHHTRAQAEAWNHNYANVPQLQVNLDYFPVSQPEITKEQSEASWARLKQLSDRFVRDQEPIFTYQGRDPWL